MLVWENQTLNTPAAYTFQNNVHVHLVVEVQKFKENKTNVKPKTIQLQSGHQFKASKPKSTLPQSVYFNWN